MKLSRQNIGETNKLGMMGRARNVEIDQGTHVRRSPTQQL